MHGAIHVLTLADCSVMLQKENSPSRQIPVTDHKTKELQHALQTANMYERQISDLLLNLKKADQKWEHAKQVPLLSVSQISLCLCLYPCDQLR
jgi:hypothetical protein